MHLEEAQQTIIDYQSITVTYLQFWFRQKFFWYCKMIQFILVWVCKPSWIENHKFK